MRAHRIKSTMRVYHVFNPHTAKEPISPFLASDWSMFVNLSVTKATRGRIYFMSLGTHHYLGTGHYLLAWGLQFFSTFSKKIMTPLLDTGGNHPPV